MIVLTHTTSHGRGADHFSFLNQPVAAERNFEMFCTALQPLLESDLNAMQQLNEIRNGFGQVMQEEMEKMLAAKLGLDTFNAALFNEVATLMMQTSVDYTIFFRELSMVPDDIGPLKKSFYNNLNEEIDKRWTDWLTKWKLLIANTSNTRIIVPGAPFK